MKMKEAEKGRSTPGHSNHKSIGTSEEESSHLLARRR